MKLLSVAIVLLLVTNFFILFLLVRERTKPPHDRQLGDKPELKSLIIEKLHFDDAQAKQYQRLIDRHRFDVRNLENRIYNVKTSLYRTLSKENAGDRDSLETNLGVLQKQMETVHYNHFAQIKRLCRPEQIVYFDALSIDLAAFFVPEKKLPPPPKD